MGNGRALRLKTTVCAFALMGTKNAAQIRQSAWAYQTGDPETRGSRCVTGKARCSCVSTPSATTKPNSTQGHNASRQSAASFRSSGRIAHKRIRQYFDLQAVLR